MAQFMTYRQFEHLDQRGRKAPDQGGGIHSVGHEQSLIQESLSALQDTEGWTVGVKTQTNG